MSFDLSAFVAAPFTELLNFAKKTDLLDTADHYKLTTVKGPCLNLKLRMF